MGRAKKLAVAAAFLTAACGSGRLEPVALPLDQVSCAACGMLISDPRTAAQAVSAGEDPRFYDDIGCAAADRTLAKPGIQVFVSAGGGARWIRAEAAYFARPRDFRSPMGYDLAAFDSRSEAQSRDRGARPRTWIELRSEMSAGLR